MKTQEYIDQLVDKTIEKALDKAIVELSKSTELETFAMLIQDTHCVTEVLPSSRDYYFDNSVLMDSLKEFGNEQIETEKAEGFCIVFQTEVPLHGKNQQAIGLFFKMKDDYLALKSRMYYFPFNRLGNIPQIDFESAFASEA